MSVTERDVKMTRTEQKIYNLLGDGQPHSRHDILLHLDPDGLMSLSTLQVHMTYLRRKLPPGELLVYVLRGKSRCYQRVRSLSSPYDGRV